MNVIILDLIVTSFQIGCYLVFLGNENCKGQIKRGIFFLVFVVGAVYLSYLGVPIVGKIIFFIVCFSFAGKLVYGFPFIIITENIIIIITTIMGSEMIAYQIWNLFDKPVNSQNLIYANLEVTISYLSSILYLMAILVLKQMKDMIANKEKIRDIIPIVLTGIPFLIVIITIIISIPFIYNVRIRILFLISIVVLFVAFICQVFFVKKYITMQLKRRDEEKIVYELEMKNEYYLGRAKAEEKVRKIYHDLQNHVLISGDSKLSLQIRKEMENYEKYYDTGNDFLNIVLADKLEIADNKEIKIACNVNFNDGDFVKPFDISTIFGNLLDNAIEAVVNLEAEGKNIFFDVLQKNSMIVVVIKNSKNDNVFDINKKNQGYHGFGLKNIQKAVENYNGQMNIYNANKEFVVNIILPIPRTY